MSNRILKYFRLRRKSEEVDYELEAAQSQTERLRGILRTREAEVSYIPKYSICECILPILINYKMIKQFQVQALRERVEAQRQEWARRQHQNYQN